MGGVGSTSEDSKFRFSLYLLRGFDANGGHLETRGLSPTGEVIQGPLHRHNVSLDVARFQLDIAYRLTADWDIALSLPYDIKDQDAFIDEIAPVTLEERSAILRNQDIHHRDEVYRGFADARLLVSHSLANLLRDTDLLMVSFGTSIPIGATEEDPFILGDAGERHLHIQFGTGTFDPSAALHYETMLSDGISLNASIHGQFPVYENGKTYRGPVDVTETVGIRYQVGDWLALHASHLGLFQSYAYWDGIRDINSGLIFNALQFGVVPDPRFGVPIRLNVMLPIQRRVLSEEGDAFEVGPTVSMAVSYQL
jgi:hypothetical protein